MLTILKASSLFLTIAWSPAPNDQCKIDNYLPRPNPVRVDWKKAAKTDYFALVLSWSPQHCYESHRRSGGGNAFQCETNKFQFVVHGLWPQTANARNKFDHPRNCNSVDLVSEKLIRQNICIVPGVQLIQTQWGKHGACAFNTAESYFGTINRLWRTLKKPDLNHQAHRQLSSENLINLFVRENQTAGLKPEHMQVRVNNGGYLREVIVCYNKKFAFTQCELGGTPGHVDVKVHFDGAQPRRRERRKYYD